MFFSILYKRTERFLHSFPFFIKERNLFCVLFRSLLKNGMLFAFFSILYKRIRRSLRSFTFFIKERNVVSHFVGVPSQVIQKLQISQKKVRKCKFLLVIEKNCVTFFAKERCILCILLRSLQKNVAFFAFFYALCKRTLRSLRSFPFFRKECCILCVLFRSFGFHKSPKTQKKNRKERCVL